MRNVYGIIMAGGGGTRFWPLSREKAPKQLLNLSGKDVMVKETATRLARITPYENLYLVTNCVQAAAVEAALQGKIAADRILREPSAHNTAACIGLAAVTILKTRGDGVLVVAPADAYIRDEAEYARVLRLAVKKAEETGCPVTVGITPTFPATGYGYIRMGEAEGEFRRVLKFVEKPNEERAEEFLKSGDFVWNSGIFVWKASVVLDKFRVLLPDIYEALMSIERAVGTPQEKDAVAAAYAGMRSISVDNGILEHCDDTLVIPAEFGWSDVGSWDMLGAVREADGEGNVTVGDTLLLDCKDTTAYSSGRLVAALGVEGLVIVETADAVLVCPKDRAQEVKKIAEALRADGREELL